MSISRPHDYWEGYKIFCYAYYSHSEAHVIQFRGTKLGRIVWNHHERNPPHLRQTIAKTCMDLLPLIEMYLRWELQEDVSNLRSLMLRFDDEEELCSHVLGQSLVLMVASDGGGLEGLNSQIRSAVQIDLFAEIRERLRVVDNAFNDIANQVEGFLHVHINKKIIAFDTSIVFHDGCIVCCL